MMENLIAIVALLGGLLLRIGVPLGITLGLVYLFTRLDTRWQKEAARKGEVRGAGASLARNIGCWKINGCPEEKRQSCKAYSQPESPCWQVYRQADGSLQGNCLGCKVFKEAPLPEFA
jgi:hypothetical protein